MRSLALLLIVAVYGREIPDFLGCLFFFLRRLGAERPDRVKPRQSVVVSEIAELRFAFKLQDAVVEGLLSHFRLLIH